MKLTPGISRRNFKAFMWHSIFFALAKNFMDVDTVIPAMLVESGGQAMHIGILATIMLGGSGFAQIFFAPFLSNRPFKKRPILIGINIRILSLFGLGLLMLYSAKLQSNQTMWLIMLLLAMFSFGGSYASISYTDILGKSILEDARKSFFSIRQLIMGIGAFVSVILVARLLTWKAYPINYSYMLFAGFLGLWIASLGFWRLKEVLPSGMSIKNTRHFLRVIRQELKANHRLKYFLGYVNTLGLSLAFLPFVILYAKTQFQTDAGDTGSFLIYKVLGMVTTSFIIFLLAKKVKYRYLLYFSSSLAVILPIILMSPFERYALDLVFLIGGVVIAIYNISMNGVLLELSGTRNRTVYAGIAGAGNILPVLFPLFSGWVIHQFGFNAFFVLYLSIILTSFYFIYRLDCRK